MRPLVRAAILSIAVAAAAMALPTSASAVTCQVAELGAAGPPGNELRIAVGHRDGLLTLEPVDGRLRVARSSEDEPERLVCAGELSLTSFDAITVRVSRLLLEGGLILNLEEGPLGPGATPEADGGSEIEVALRQPGKPRTFGGPRGRRFTVNQLELRVLGQQTADSFAFATSRKRLRANLSASANDLDTDLVMEAPSFTNVDAGTGDDVVTTSRKGQVLMHVDGEAGDDVLSSLRGPTDLTGGEGNDTLRGAGGADGLFGDEGADLILGKGGRDFIAAGSGMDVVMAGGGRDRVLSGGDGEPDTIGCGGGLDRFSADSKDTLTGCERRIRKRRLAQPQPVGA